MRRLLAFLLMAAPAMAQDAGGTPPHSTVAYTVLNAATIPEPLTATPGDRARGAVVWSGHCADCHAAGGAPLPEALSGSREMGALRLAVVNIAIARPDVEAHAFHDVSAAADQANGPVLSAQAVEDVLSWMAGLARQRDRERLDLRSITP